MELYTYLYNIHSIYNIWLITDTITPKQTAALNNAEHPGEGRATLHNNKGPVITSLVIPKQDGRVTNIQLFALIGVHVWHSDECIWGA